MYENSNKLARDWNYKIFIYDSHFHEIVTNCLVIDYNSNYAEIVFPTFNKTPNGIELGKDKSKSSEDDIGEQEYNVYRIEFSNGISFPYINPVTKFVVDNELNNLPFSGAHIHIKKSRMISKNILMNQFGDIYC